MVSVGILSWATVGCVLIYLEYYIFFKTQIWIANFLKVGLRAPYSLMSNFISVKNQLYLYSLHLTKIVSLFITFNSITVDLNILSFLHTYISYIYAFFYCFQALPIYLWQSCFITALIEISKRFIQQIHVYMHKNLLRWLK